MGEIDPVDVVRLSTIMDALDDAGCLPHNIDVRGSRTVKLTWQFADEDREADDE